MGASWSCLRSRGRGSVEPATQARGASFVPGGSHAAQWSGSRESGGTADALSSGGSVLTGVGVQIPPLARRVFTKLRSDVGLAGVSSLWGRVAGTAPVPPEPAAQPASVLAELSPR